MLITAAEKPRSIPPSGVFVWDVRLGSSPGVFARGVSSHAMHVARTCRRSLGVFADRGGVQGVGRLARCICKRRL
jgi:hypothetical protein